MNENLNLVEILKDAPKGTRLWSPVCGECELLDVNIICKSLPIVCIDIDDGLEWHFKANGTFIENTGVECVLSPSRTNRDWSTFRAPKDHKEFKPFEKVLRVDDMAVKNPYPWIKAWSADFYSYYDKDTHTHYFVSGYTAKDDEIIPYTGNEDKLGEKVK